MAPRNWPGLWKIGISIFVGGPMLIAALWENIRNGEWLPVALVATLISMFIAVPVIGVTFENRLRNRAKLPTPSVTAEEGAKRIDAHTRRWRKAERETS